MSSHNSMENKTPSAASPAEDSRYVLGTHRGPLAAPDDGVTPIESRGDEISLEKSPATRQTKVQKFKRHWGRFWCCYVLFSVIFLAIFLPIFFLVVIPAVAQLVVNKSELLLVSASVMAPRPHSMTLSIESALDLPIALPVRIEPLVLDLFNRDLPENNTWGKLYLDGAVIKGNTTLSVNKQPTPLVDDQWYHYVHQVIFTPHSPLSVRGETNAFLGKLKSHVHINKDIPQNTLNSFAGFSIKDPILLLDAREDGTNLIANATLPNPSVLTLEIGTVLLDLKSGDHILGNCTIDNLVLRPGNHSTPVRSILDLPYLLNNLKEILGPERDSLRNGELTLDVVGRSVHYDGVEIPYYTKAMQALTLQAKIALGQLVLNTLREVVNPNGTNLLHNLTDPNGPTDIQDILESIDDPDGSLGLDNIDLLS